MATDPTEVMRDATCLYLDYGHRCIGAGGRVHPECALAALHAAGHRIVHAPDTDPVPMVAEYVASVGPLKSLTALYAFHPLAADSQGSAKPGSNSAAEPSPPAEEA